MGDPASTCQIPGCGRPVLSKGCCVAHYWQKKRGRPISEVRQRYQSKREMALEAMNHLQDTNPLDNQAWQRAWDRVRKAWWRYFHHRPDGA